MTRIDSDPSEAVKSEALVLLGWMVCAKRSLRWNEAQIMKSIDLDSQTVNFDGKRWRVEPKDLCQSLVELGSDGSLEFVHVTARL